MKYSVRRSTRLVVESQQNIPANGAFAILLLNKGTDNATIDDNIPLNAGDSYVYNYLPNCEIEEPFKITFAGAAAATQKVVMIYSFAKPKQ